MEVIMSEWVSAIGQSVVVALVLVVLKMLGTIKTTLAEHGMWVRQHEILDIERFTNLSQSVKEVKDDYRMVCGVFPKGGNNDGQTGTDRRLEKVEAVLRQGGVDI